MDPAPKPQPPSPSATEFDDLPAVLTTREAANALRIGITELRKLVDAEAQALKSGKDRKAAIYAAYDRFYRGDIARELVQAVREAGGLFTLDDLANWKVHIEEPVHSSYRGI